MTKKNKQKNVVIDQILDYLHLHGMMLFTIIPTDSYPFSSGHVLLLKRKNI